MRACVCVWSGSVGPPPTIVRPTAYAAPLEGHLDQPPYPVGSMWHTAMWPRGLGCCRAVDTRLRVVSCGLSERGEEEERGEEGVMEG